MQNQTKIEKFYQKLQQKFSRRINLDRSRIFLALNKFGIDPDLNLSGEIIQCIGSDGKNCVVQFLKSVLIENKKRVTTFTSPAIISPLDRIFLRNKFYYLFGSISIRNCIVRIGIIKIKIFDSCSEIGLRVFLFS